MPDAGPVMLVEGASSNEAIVVGPQDEDSVIVLLQASAARSAEISLFGRGGSRTVAHLNPMPDRHDADCTVWTVRSLKADGANSGWSVGFLGTGAQPLALDSVDILSPRDSMTLVAEATRLASAVLAPSDPIFQGLRFTAHDIRRFETAPGISALTAHMIRRVNQEANPQEEQTLLIAERDSGVTSGPYHLVYAERSSGLEEQETTSEVIGAALIGGRASLIVARDSDAGISYSVLERVGPQRWRIRWTSKPTSCG